MATEVVMPKLGLTMTEGTIESWLVKEGDHVAQGDIIAEISSEKLSSPVEASVAGVILKITVQEGESVPCLEAIAHIGEEGEQVGESPSGGLEVAEEAKEKVQEHASSSDNASVAPQREIGERVFITPLARKMAEESGIDINDVNGTGGNGRITKLDIERYVPKPKVSETAETVQASPALAVEHGQGLDGLRKTIAQRMMRSLESSAQVTNQRKVDITALMAFRKRIQKKVNVPLDKGEISLTTLLTKAVVLALQEMPEMNAWYYKGEYARQEDIHIGMATAMDEGLVVPVIQHADQMPLSKLGPAIKQVTSQVRDGTLPGDLYSGSTFTITNLGGLNIEYFTPIINTPEVAILGVGAIQKELAFDDYGELVERKMLPLSLTYDHQVIDGAPAAEFLEIIAQYLNDPFRLIL